MRKLILLVTMAYVSLMLNAATPVDALLERIDKGASGKFVIEKKSSDVDFFELDQKGQKVVVRGNTWVNIAAGVNWYLKYYANVHLSWNCMKAALPAVLPKVEKTERHETDLKLRYDFNYCTFSYSMAFWDWERWQTEIDWMALHGINMPLAAVGHECVWRNMMLRLGYSEEQVGKFIAGPAFLAWWEMNNLEGWGGPLPLNWYKQQEALQKKILKRMKELDMHPVLPGYSGMCPSEETPSSPDPNSPPLWGEGVTDGKTNTSLSSVLPNSLLGEGVTDGKTNTSLSPVTPLAIEGERGPGERGSSGESSQSSLQKWNGFTRPGVIFPGDKRFDQYAKLFYEETKKLYGSADFYSIDPFHEASNLPENLNIGEAGKEILRAMKHYGNEHSTWVVQGWSENPRPEMLDALPNGDVLVLDLFSECRPQYGAKNSVWYRPQGYGEHDWAFCMLENFGANVGMHGRMDQLINYYYAARSEHSKHLKGWGFTMEGSETNPIMYELMSELPWRAEKIDKHEWVMQYVMARYGLSKESIDKATVSHHNPYNNLFAAWNLLADGIYNCPDGNNQQGPHESIFCSRPSLDCFQASSWSKMTNYYDPNTTMQAAMLMLSFADLLKGNDNYEYDLIDLCRQAIADRGRVVYQHLVADFKSFDRKAFKKHKREFLDLLLKQDSLLSTRPEFCVGRWIGQARSLGKTAAESDLYEWNARVQITTWGDRYCADTGKLRDYAHKEWSGILRDFYYPRWSHYLQILEDELDGKLPVLPTGNSSQLKNAQDNPALTVDWYAMEEPWTLSKNHYPSKGKGSAIEVAKAIIEPLLSSPEGRNW